MEKLKPFTEDNARAEPTSEKASLKEVLRLCEEIRVICEECRVTLGGMNEALERVYFRYDLERRVALEEPQPRKQLAAETTGLVHVEVQGHLYTF